MRFSFWPRVSLLAICYSTSLGAAGRSPCDAHRTQPSWHIFVDNKDRFCFEYPSRYQVAPAVFASGVTNGPATEFLGWLTTKPGPTALAGDEDNATIDVLAYGMPFRPDGLTRFAPTGLDDTPPTRIHTAHGDFYYYGPGGGGVAYRDAYYFGLQGRTFSIQFFGPYAGNKTPAAVTKQIEPKVLASFRRF
jgi:hypothetical protein